MHTTTIEWSPRTKIDEAELAALSDRLYVELSARAGEHLGDAVFLTTAFRKTTTVGIAKYTKSYGGFGRVYGARSGEENVSSAARECVD